MQIATVGVIASIASPFIMFGIGIIFAIREKKVTKRAEGYMRERHMVNKRSGVLMKSQIILLGCVKETETNGKLKEIQDVTKELLDVEAEASQLYFDIAQESKR